MSDNVMVCCRFRPRNQTELSMRDDDVIECPDNRTVYISTAALAEEKRSASMKAVFAFDYVFKPGSSQEEVFEHTARDFSDEVMKGFNCTIFAYGQTGSGKTFTMMGVPGNEGIIPRLASSIFDYIDQADEQIQFTVKISYVEIYMEHIKDLLEPEKTNLKIREGARGVWIQDVTERYVSSIDEILEIMAIGSENRAVASTNMNDESSRSHSVFMLTVGQINKQNGSKTGSKMILVDLAGSETVAKTGASGNTLKEAQHINKSLSALGNVINALTSASPHVPYRDSKLTRLLSDSLGGNSKTCLIVTASPSIYNLDETLSTLRFGTRAKKIKNKPTVNSEKSVAEYKALLEAAIAKCTEQEELIQKLQRQIVRLKSIIREMGGRIPEDLEELAAKSTKKTVARHDDDEDFDAPDEPEPAMPTKAQQQQAVLLTLELQEQLKEKEEAVKSMQEDLDDRDLQLDQLQKELESKTVELNRLRGAKGGAVSDAEAEGKFRAQTDALESAKKRIESLEKEQVVYIQQIDRLHADNLELAHLQQLHLSTANQVQATQAAAGANMLAPPSNSERRKKSEVDGDKRKKRGSAVSGQGESDSDSDDAMDKPPSAALSAGADETIRTLRTNYDVLMAALGRKCEQYIALQMQVQKQTEKMNDMEKKLQAKPDRVETGADPAVVTKLEAQVNEMQKRLEASEALCKKLFESGLYWQKRGQRKDKELKDIKRQLSDRSINIGLSSAQSEAGDVPPSISDLRVQTYFEGAADRESSVQFNTTVSYAPPQTTRAVSEFPRPPSPQSPRSVREPVTPGGRPMSGFLSGSMRARAPSMAAKVVVPHPIYGGGKGSTKTGAAASVLRPPLTTQTFHQDAMDQFF